MDQAIHTAINWLDRTQIVAILEDYGFACYDSESTDMLRDELRANIETGIIDVAVLPSNEMKSA